MSSSIEPVIPGSGIPDFFCRAFAFKRSPNFLICVLLCVAVLSSSGEDMDEDSQSKLQSLWTSAWVGTMTPWTQAKVLGFEGSVAR